jgi:hypothetical protein
MTLVTAAGLLDMPASAVQEMPVQTLVLPVDDSGDLALGYTVHQVSSSMHSWQRAQHAWPGMMASPAWTGAVRVGIRCHGRQPTC